MIEGSFIKILLIVFASVTAVVIGDSCAKLLAQAGFSPYFITWSRFTLAAILLAPFCGFQKSEFKLLVNTKILFRGALIVAANVCNMIALQTETIANMFGAFFIGPIVAYFLSAFILKETISLPRTLLLLSGFVGVLLVVKPGFGATTGIFFALAAGFFHGTFMVVTRKVSVDFRPRFMLLSQLLCGAVVLLPVAFKVALPEMNATFLWLTLLSAVASGLGNYLLVIANKTTPTSIVAPLIYLQLFSATFVSYVVFSDLPDVISFIGLAIIATSGLASLYFAKRT